MNYEKLYDYTTNVIYGNTKVDKTTIDKFHNNIKKLIHLPKLVSEIGKVRAIRDDTNKYSATLTLEALEQENSELYYAIFFLALYGNVSNYKLGIQTKDKSFYCRLVPLALSGFKRYQNIQYEEWNKADSHLGVLVGQGLYKSITRKDLQDFIFTNEFREQIIEGARRANSDPNALSCSFRKIEYQPTIDSKAIVFGAYEPAKYILSQTWMAHCLNRNEYMILDLNDWDNQPECLDIIEEKSDVDDLSWMEELSKDDKKALNSDIPWL